MLGEVSRQVATREYGTKRTLVCVGAHPTLNMMKG